MVKKHVNDRGRNTRGNRDNRANQLNPNNDAYWKARGHNRKPSDRNNVAPARKKQELIGSNP